MNVAVVLQRAWARLGPETLAYPRITDSAGRPTLRARRTLFTRIFDAPTKYAIENAAAIADPRTIADIEAQVVAAAGRLERTVAWHRSLRDAYYRLPAADRFLTDPVERLLAPAWEHATTDLPSDPDAAASVTDAIIAALRQEAAPFTSASLARELADPDVVAAVDARLAAAWDARPLPEHPGRGAEQRLYSTAARLAAAIVPVSGVIDREADSPWRELVGDAALGALLAQHTYGLSLEREPRRPAVVADAETETAAGEAFAALDESLARRLRRILAGEASGDDAGFPAELTARAALDRAADLVARPLSLGSAEVHAVFYTATLAYIGVSAQREHSGLELPRGATRYLAARFRRAQGVAAVLEWQYGGFASVAIDFVAEPLSYALGRLWIRLSRTDYDATVPTTPAAAWAHLRGAIFSSGEHARELSKRIASRHLPTRALHDLVDTDLEPPDDDEQSDDPLDRVESRLDRAGDRDPMRIVIAHALRTDGPAAVDAYLAALAGLPDSPEQPRDLAARWERWAHAAARSRADLLGDRSSFDEQLAALPAFAQVRARVRAQRLDADARIGIGNHSVGRPGRKEDRP